MRALIVICSCGCLLAQAWLLCFYCCYCVAAALLELVEAVAARQSVLTL